MQLQKWMERKHYSNAITLLKENISKDIDSMKSYLCLIYVYFEIVVESDLPNNFDYIPDLKRTYKETLERYNRNPSFLFYVAYISSSFGEAFLGLHEDDVKRMFREALSLEPENSLYQWGYKIHTHEFTLEQSRQYALKILANKEYLRCIGSYPLVGEDLLKQLRITTNLKCCQDYYL